MVVFVRLSQTMIWEKAYGVESRGTFLASALLLLPTPSDIVGMKERGTETRHIPSCCRLKPHEEFHCCESEGWQAYPALELTQLEE